MGCFLTVTDKDINQLRSTKNVVQDTGWKNVSSDSRYEERIVQYKSGRSTRMTRVKGQPVDENGYPHTTEFYAADGKKDHFNGNLLWDGHHSPSKDGKRQGVHRTAQSILDDLGISAKA